jgi:hypothetical protein
MAKDETRARKVQTALDGNDEFSVFSVDPDIKKLKLELQAQAQVNARPEAASQSGMFMRLFRKVFK